MSLRVSGPLACGLVVLTAACVSFRTAAANPQEPILEAFALCAAVEPSGAALKPSPTKDSFGAEDHQVCCAIKVRFIPGPLTLRWKWYSPDKTVWRDTGEVNVESGSQPINAVSAYDQIRWDQDMPPKGDWTVAVFLNGHLAGRRSFKLT